MCLHYHLILDQPVYTTNVTDNVTAPANETSVVATTGDSVRIEVVIDAFPIPDNFTWFFNGQPFPITPGITVGLNFIEFDSVTPSNDGVYTVMATNIVGTGTFEVALAVQGTVLFTPQVTRKIVHAMNECNVCNVCN